VAWACSCSRTSPRSSPPWPSRVRKSSRNAMAWSPPAGAVSAVDRASVVALAAAALMAFDMFFIRLGEGSAEQGTEAGFGILVHRGIAVAEQIPVPQLDRHAQDRALHLTVEVLLQPLWIELRQHRLEGQPQ